MSYNTIVVIDEMFVKKRNVLIFVDSIMRFRVIAFFIIKCRKFVFNKLIIYNHRYICVLIKLTFRFIFFKRFFKRVFKQIIIKRYKYIIIILKIIIKIMMKKIIMKRSKIVIINYFKHFDNFFKRCKNLFSELKIDVKRNRSSVNKNVMIDTILNRLTKLI